jgi:hypothetical protein
MAYINSPTHRWNRERKKYSREERAERKKERIHNKRMARQGVGQSNPFGGILNFLQSLKKRNKEKQGESNEKAISRGKRELIKNKTG